MWRHDLKILFHVLTDAEGFGIQFRADATFSAVRERLCDWFAGDEVPAQAAGYLRHRVDAGLVIAAHGQG